MKKATVKRTRIILTLMGIIAFGIWLVLVITGELSIIGHIAFLAAAAWLFELYSAIQREGFKRPTRKPENMEERLREFEEEYNL